MMVDRCEPPPEWRHVRWHWVTAGEECRPAEWDLDQWWVGGGLLTPEHMAERGWEWLAPCLPPEGSDEGRY